MRTWALLDQLKNALIENGWPLAPVQSTIVPLHVGAETKAVALGARLRASGVFVPAIRYPTVARGAARLRLTVTAAHTAEDVREFAACLGQRGE